MKNNRAAQRSAKEWATIIQSARSSGQNITKWCQERGLCTRQFYYWDKKLRDEGTAVANNKGANRFYELSQYQAGFSDSSRNDVTEFTGTILQYGKFNVLVTDKTTESTITAVIRGIRNA